MKKELIETEDGSHSLYIPEMDENYHSTHGAWTESMHIFIKHGYQLIHKPTCSILEIGFGTGLNAMLTAHMADRLKKETYFHTLEAFPISNKLLSALNFDEKFTKEKPGYDSYFTQIHKSSWEQDEVVHPYFKILKEEIKLQDCKNFKSYDLIYFDAFAPEKQPEMWTEEIFQNMYNVLNPKGVLTTYCAKGVVKRMLKKAGFIVKNYPGPPGKREITVAFKS